MTARPPLWQGAGLQVCSRMLRPTSPTERWKLDRRIRDLIKDNLNSVKNIYSKNSFKFDKLANDEIKEYMNSNKRGKHGQVIYNLEDFGVDKSEFYESFKFYFDEFDVLKEI